MTIPTPWHTATRPTPAPSGWRPSRPISLHGSVTFGALCPAGHPAEWTQRQVEGCRGDATVSEVRCPVCEAASPGAGGGSDGLGGGSGLTGRDGVDLGAQRVAEGDAA